MTSDDLPECFSHGLPHARSITALTPAKNIDNIFLKRRRSVNLIKKVLFIRVVCWA
jgi:hypothetical protein